MPSYGASHTRTTSCMGEYLISVSIGSFKSAKHVVSITPLLLIGLGVTALLNVNVGTPSSM